MRSTRAVNGMMLLGLALLIIGLFVAGMAPQQADPLEDWEREIYQRVIRVQAETIDVLRSMSVTQAEAWRRNMTLPRTGAGQPWVIRCAAVTAIEPTSDGGCVVAVYGARYATTMSADEVEALVWSAP